MKSIKLSKSQEKCFRLQTPRTPKKATPAKQYLPIPFARMSQQAIDLVKSHKFIYLDITGLTPSKKYYCKTECPEQDQSIVKGMILTNKFESKKQEEEEQVEKIAKNDYVRNLGALSIQSQRFIDYMMKVKEMKKQRDNFDRIRQKKDSISLKSEKQRFLTSTPLKNQARNRNRLKIATQDKINSIQVLDNEEIIRRIANNDKRSQDTNVTCRLPREIYMHRGMKMNDLKEYLRQKQMHEMNTTIMKKQEKLASRYCIQRDFLKKMASIRRPHTQLMTSHYNEPKTKSFSHFKYLA